MSVAARGSASRLLFFGTPEFAIPTLEALIDSPHRVVAVVCQPDRPRGRGQALAAPPVARLAATHGIPVLQPERLRDPAVAPVLAAYEADVGIVAAYGQIVPDSIRHAARLGLINVHASLLPKYRGAAPVQRAIIAGERMTGVTIMRLVRALDAGPMLDAVTRPIGLDETSDVVERDLATIGARLLVDVLERLLAGTVAEVAQDDSQATYAARITRADGIIDWSRPARAIHDLVRGLHPWPHAFTHLDAQRYLLLRSAVASGETDATPGAIVEAGERLLVATGRRGLLDILELQREGRRPMPAAAFLAGHRLPVGSRFAASATA